MSSENVRVVERFEHAFVRGDMDEVLSLLHEDIVVHEAPSLPYAGDHHGHDGFLALAAAFNRVWEMTSPLDVYYRDTAAIVEATGGGRAL
jgi:ketosteroid isomerase-like protein